MIDVEGIAKALDPKARQIGREWRLICPNPAHEDKTPSCYLKQENDQLLWHCFGCQDQVAVRQAIEGTGLYQWEPSTDSRENWRRNNAYDTWLDKVREAIREAREDDFSHVTMADIRQTDFPPEIRYLGPIYRAKIGMFVAPTGSGKTFFCHALADSLSSGYSLAHWGSQQKCRVAVVDGEMTGMDLRRIGDDLDLAGEYAVFGAYGTEGGYINLMDPVTQKWILGRLEGFDVVLFDNVYSLFPTTEKVASITAEYGQALTAFFLQLKMNGISAYAFDHPAKSGAQFGTITKSWGLDLLGIMTRPKGEFDEGFAGFDLSFRSEDGGKVRGWFDGEIHRKMRWKLESMRWQTERIREKKLEKEKF